MPDILSSEELGALLNAFCAKNATAGPAATKSVRTWDFARPSKIQHEHLKAIKAVHNKFASALAEALPVTLHVPCELKLSCLEHLSYQEYTSTCSSKSLFYSAGISPVSSTAILEYDLPVASACIDALIGGGGGGLSSDENLTELDRAIMGRVAEVTLRKYEDAWASHFITTAGVKTSLLSANLMNLFISNEPMLVFRFSAQVDKSKGIVSLCIPAMSLEAILPKLKLPAPKPLSNPQTQTFSPIMQEVIDDIPIACKAILGRTLLTMEDLMNLQSGDIIKLSSIGASEVEFWVGDKQQYAAQAGQSGSKMGIVITRPLASRGNPVN